MHSAIGTHYQFLWYMARVFLPGRRQLCRLTALIQPARYADILTQKVHLHTLTVSTNTFMHILNEHFMCTYLHLTTCLTHSNHCLIPSPCALFDIIAYNVFILFH